MQEIIVIIIGICILGFIGWKVYKAFTKKDNGNNVCSNCDIDCALKDMRPKKCDKKEK